MPMTIIRSSRPENGQTLKKGPTFTGEVWYDSVLNKQEEGITMVTATFTPCARTHWHHHEDGQVLEVKAGSGWVCDKGGVPQKLSVGDIVWCPAGTVHWHGADEGSILVHLAISRGKTTWYEAVTDEEYNARLGNKGK
ncbi:Cupin-2 domain-containing protein [Fusarium falciforme]|uniref:Cupin-2 domain-containing protein n=1 Tax=Fusarium falciforme TaxID=195108 RepID=UPI0023002E3D|nr:Cupin-2 domain-containing protein [Fusarium falciforme]WAO91767.1 Cupin-2 domain-containing protein [Fusarium falciforme]